MNRLMHEWREENNQDKPYRIVFCEGGWVWFPEYNQFEARIGGQVLEYCDTLNEALDRLVYLKARERVIHPEARLPPGELIVTDQQGNRVDPLYSADEALALLDAA